MIEVKPRKEQILMSFKCLVSGIVATLVWRFKNVFVLFFNRLQVGGKHGLEVNPAPC